MNALTSHQQLAASALIGQCEATLKAGVVENEAQFRFVLNQMRTAFGMPPLPDPSDVVVETYRNPHLPGRSGFHAHDDAGNHGFGSTRDEALAEYQSERDLFGEPASSEAEYDRGLEAIAGIFGVRP